MPIYLVRHGHAGSRRQWQGDDEDRPLSERGRDQAHDLLDLFDGHELGVLWSSPLRRCMQTLEPLAARRGAEVRSHPRLAEGAVAGDTLDWLLGEAGANPVACSHGDVIPAVIRLLAGRGADVTPGGASKKGSVWIIDVDGTTPTAARYLDPVS